MSETTVTIIGMVVTAYVTVLGMMAAFVTASIAAFLAEPVKTYFQNRARLQNLRLALYRELVYNYSWLDVAYDSDWEKDPDTLTMYLRAGIFAFRNECYMKAITGEADLFYQLPEAHEFNTAYAMLGGRSGFPSVEEEDISAEQRRESMDTFRRLCQGFVGFVAMRFYTGELNRAILARIVDEKQYQQVMQRAIQHSQPHPIQD